VWLYVSMREIVISALVLYMSIFLWDQPIPSMVKAILLQVGESPYQVLNHLPQFRLQVVQSTLSPPVYLIVQVMMQLFQPGLSSS